MIWKRALHGHNESHAEKTIPGGSCRCAVADRDSQKRSFQPFTVSLLAGGQLAGVWQAGVLVELEPEWKTYWRMPGDTGIPPQFDWTGSTNSEAVEVSFPVPRRFNDLSGEAIGYS